MTQALEVHKVAFSYGSQPVLKDISFDLKPGETMGLIGENGAGKTTLLKLLQAQLPATGQLSIFGHHIQDKCVRNWLGAMPQGDLMLPGVTVYDLLKNLSSKYTHPANVDQLLRANELMSLKDKRLDRLSGGQLRRVTFLSALVGQPRLLILDEPTVGMDVAARERFWQQVRQMKQAGVTIIITSHYLEEIQDVADRLVILQAGRIRFQGDFAELQTHYKQTVFRFVSPLAQAELLTLSGVESVTKEGRYWLLTSQDSDQTLRQLSLKIEHIHDLTITKQSLATIFSDMIQPEESK